MVENLFYYLWCKDELDNGPTINIPDTVIYKFRQPAVWYFTAMDGSIKKKSKGNLVNVKIEEAFTRNHMGCDIVAYHLVTDEEQGGQTTIEYFNRHTLHDFLYNREKNNNGVLQRFIEPKGETGRRRGGCGGAVERRRGGAEAEGRKRKGGGGLPFGPLEEVA